MGGLFHGYKSINELTSPKKTVQGEGQLLYYPGMAPDPQIKHKRRKKSAEEELAQKVNETSRSIEKSGQNVYLDIGDTPFYMQLENNSGNEGSQEAGFELRIEDASQKENDNALHFQLPNGGSP